MNLIIYVGSDKRSLKKTCLLIVMFAVLLKESELLNYFENKTTWASLAPKPHWISVNIPEIIS